MRDMLCGSYVGTWLLHLHVDLPQALAKNLYENNSDSQTEVQSPMTIFKDPLDGTQEPCLKGLTDPRHTIN